MLEAFRKETPEEEPPRPNIRKLQGLLQGPFSVRSIALNGLFVLASFYTLYFGRAFFLPIVLALLLSFLLSPVVRGLKKVAHAGSSGRGAGHLQPAGAAGARRRRAGHSGV